MRLQPVYPTKGKRSTKTCAKSSQDDEKASGINIQEQGKG